MRTSGVRAHSAVISILVLALFIPASAGAAVGWRERIARAREAAQKSCEDAMISVAKAGGEILEGAGQGVEQIQNAFWAFANTVDFDGVGAGTAGGAAGAKALFLRTLSVPKTVAMAYRIWRFTPDVEGLRDGMFGPMTDLVRRLRAMNEEVATLPTEARVQWQVETYGELVMLVFEVALKAYKTVPRVLLEVVPTGLASLLPTWTAEPPASVEELAVLVIRTFLRNAFRAITSRGLALEERFALLNLDMATIEASGRFARDAGIVEFLEALREYRGSADLTPADLEAIDRKVRTT